MDGRDRNKGAEKTGGRQITFDAAAFVGPCLGAGIFASLPTKVSVAGEDP